VLRSVGRRCSRLTEERGTRVAGPRPTSDGGYHSTRWSKSKSGSVWRKRFQSGIGSGALSQAEGPRAVAIGGVTIETDDARNVRSGLHCRRRWFKSRCLLRVESGHRLATSVHYPGSRRGEPPVKPSTIAEIEGPVVVRPGPAFAVAETAGGRRPVRRTEGTAARHCCRCRCRHRSNGHAGSAPHFRAVARIERHLGAEH